MNRALTDRWRNVFYLIHLASQVLIAHFQVTGLLLDRLTLSQKFVRLLFQLLDLRFDFLAIVLQTVRFAQLVVVPKQNMRTILTMFGYVFDGIQWTYCFFSRSRATLSIPMFIRLCPCISFDVELLCFEYLDLTILNRWFAV